MLEGKRAILSKTAKKIAKDKASRKQYSTASTAHSTPVKDLTPTEPVGDFEMDSPKPYRKLLFEPAEVSSFQTHAGDRFIPRRIEAGSDQRDYSVNLFERKD